jgi:uncharacterized protein (TIGR03435 family)
LCLLSVCTVFAQAPDDSLTFEVASVKLHPPVGGEPAGSSFNGGPGTGDPGRITVTNRMLRTLIIEAYGIRAFQLESPPWVSENRYDIVAKVPPGATAQQAKAMMKNLLAERLHLQVRREMRDLPIYALLVAKEGLKMKLNEAVKPAVPVPASRNPDVLAIDGDGFPQRPPGLQGIVMSYVEDRAKAGGEKQSLSKIVSWLTAVVNDRPVIDLTGLKGDYDFSMTWSPDPDSNLGDFFSAIQRQLGLRLEPRKMPTEMLIFVSALKVPTEN